MSTSRNVTTVRSAFASMGGGFVASTPRAENPFVAISEQRPSQASTIPLNEACRSSPAVVTPR